MQVFVQLLITGIAMGFIYALVGIEYTLIWNATGLLNFSHDKFILFGAYMFAGTFIWNCQRICDFQPAQQAFHQFVRGYRNGYPWQNHDRVGSSDLGSPSLYTG